MRLVCNFFFQSPMQIPSYVSLVKRTGEYSLVVQLAEDFMEGGITLIVERICGDAI